MRYFYLPALLLILAVISCNKTPTSSADASSILQTGSWKLASGTVAMRLPNGIDTTLDYYNVILPACHRADYIKFYSNTNGAVYTAGSCYAYEPDSISFTWALSNNNNSLNLYGTQLFYYSVFETILPYHFDTISHAPLELDSFYYAGAKSKVDSIHNLTFVDTPALATPPSTNLVNIYNASLINLTHSSFTLKFSVYGSYPDSVNFHAIRPIYSADTFHYSLTYNNF
jgi:hypothetical protein